MNIKNYSIYILMLFSILTGCEKNIYYIIEDEDKEDTTEEDEEENKDPYDIIYDDTFYGYLVEQFDSDKDGKLSSKEANVVKEIGYNANTYHLQSLKDLEKFPNLEKLSLHSIYGINRLDLSKNKKLKILSIDATGASLNLSANPELKELYYTNIPYGKSLDLSGNPKLEILNCSNAKIDSLNLEYNTELVELYMANLRLNDFNLGEKPKLIKMDATRTNFSPSFTLDLRSAPKLKSLLCENPDSPISLKLDISNTSIEQLTVPDYILSVIAKGCKSLKYLSCSSRASLIDVSESGIEEIVYAPIVLEYDSWGRYEEFNPERFHAVDIWAASAPVLLLNDCPNLKEFYYYQKITGSIPGPGEVPDHMGRLTIDISNCTSLTKFHANHVTEIKMDNCPALQEFVCKGSFTLH